MDSKSFGELITFSRASVARYFNSAGLMVQAGANEPRFEYSPDTLLPLGLKMEPARTNTLTYSQDFSNAAWVKANNTVTASASTAPDGTMTAQQITGTGAAGVNYVYRVGWSWVSGVSYSLSIFAKAGTATTVSLTLPAAGFTTEQRVNFNLTASGSFVVATGTPAASITRLPNGWYRCSLTATSTTTATANWIVIPFVSAATTSVVLWGAQIEVGAWNSSYIATTAASATRSADSAYMGALAPWYSFSEGTLYSEVVSNVSAFHASIGTTNGAGPRIANWRTSNTAASQIIDDAGTTVFAQAFGLVSPGQVIKQAVAFKLDDMQAASNGVAGVIDTSGAPPLTVTRLALGARGTATDQISGHIRKVKFFPYRLSGPELQAITT